MVTTLVACACSLPSDSSSESKTLWRKGNLHTHSLWSDGDQFPEAVATWYKDNGYSFLAISDHNTIAAGEKWIEVSAGTRHERAYRAMLESFGSDSVPVRDSLGKTYARLSTFDQYRDRIESPGEFLMIRAEEISDQFGSLPLHINATNIQELIGPRGGESVRDVLQRNLDAISRQRRETGARIVPHINHPNFYWGVSASDLAFLTGDKFFEIYNGHPLVRNEGDSTHFSTEQIWDYVLAARLSRGMDLMYGLATDDAHHYFDQGAKFATTGRGWVMVDSRSLTADSILSALESGKFYASSGVVVSNIKLDGSEFSFEIDASPGTDYRTEFIASSVISEPDDDLSMLQEGVGRVVGIDSSSSPAYSLRGDELYVRARVTSSKLKKNPYTAGEFERAWLQPVVLK